MEGIPSLEARRGNDVDVSWRDKWGSLEWTEVEETVQSLGQEAESMFSERWLLALCCWSSLGRVWSIRILR